MLLGHFSEFGFRGNINTAWITRVASIAKATYASVIPGEAPIVLAYLLVGHLSQGGIISERFSEDLERSRGREQLGSLGKCSFACSPSQKSADAHSFLSFVLL